MYGIGPERVLVARLTRGDEPALAEGGFSSVARVSMLSYPLTIHRNTILVSALIMVGDATDHRSACYYELALALQGRITREHDVVPPHNP